MRAVHTLTPTLSRRERGKKLHMKGQAVHEAGWGLLAFDALIQRHNAEPRVRQPVRRHDSAAVQHRRQSRRRPGRQALGHRQQQHAAVGLGQQAALGDRPAGGERRG